MFNIDLSLISGGKQEREVDNQEDTNLPANIYNEMVVRNIKNQRYNVSGCFQCSTCLPQITPLDDRNIVEIECNGLLNCDYCEIKSGSGLELYPGDFVIVHTNDSTEVAQVKLIGEIVKLKRQSYSLWGENLPSVLRKATSEDLERIRKNISDEGKAVQVFRNSINKFNLNMKLVSIHYQFDRKKLFFFYTSDNRVDFRELAKELASEFKTRIELRQIGVRDEAKKVGGVGTCGREFCCISFLAGFRRITTQLANEQNLLSSMGKLSGPCGKLKCCLSFEIE